MRNDTVDYSHLHALEFGLSNERARLANARTPHEIAMRTAWVQGRERELAFEREFLGLPPDSLVELSDADLLAELHHDGAIPD